MIKLRPVLEKFVDETLLDFEEQTLWRADFRGSSLPVCQRQLMLSEFYKHEITTPKPFTLSYHFEVGRAIHRLVQRTWALQSLLWGDWQCLDRENCGAFFQNTILDYGRCRRCNHEAEYVEKTVRDEASGFSGHCDGVTWCQALNGYLTLELKSRNANIIKKHEDQRPYESDFYQVSAYATLLHRQYSLPIVGRLLLWIGKPKPRPYRLWYYPGLGEELFESQVQAKHEAQALIASGKVLEVPGTCESMEDVGHCPFGGICFSNNRNKLILEKYTEWCKKCKSSKP